MQVLIVTDQEGVSGCVGGGYGKALSPAQKDEYQKLMMGEINALVEGCVQANCSEIIVAEAHPVDLTALHPAAKLARGIPWHEVMKLRPFDAALFVGQHARTGLADGVRAHTGSSNSIIGFWINGQSMGELGYLGGLLGARDVPVIFLSGDTAACAEAKELIRGPVVTVEVEESHNVHGAVCLPPAKTGDLLVNGVREAFQKRSKIKPISFASPITFEIELKHARIADDFCIVPGTKRTGPRRVEFSAENYEEAYMGAIACLGLVLTRYDG